MSKTPADVELETAITRVRERVGYFQRGKQGIQNVTFYQDDIALLLAAYDAQKSCEVDAARYQWLRQEAEWYGNGGKPTVWIVIGTGADDAVPASGDDVDRIIDAALAGQPAPKDGSHA